MTENQKGALGILGIGVMCAYIILVPRDQDTKPEFDKAKNAYIFGEYTCKDECQGHAAGYEWAKEHSIDDDADCEGKSQSFSEGCKQRVKDVFDAAEMAAEEQQPDGE